MKRTLSFLFLLVVAVAFVWGCMNIEKFRRLADGPICIPGKPCPSGTIPKKV